MPQRSGCAHCPTTRPSLTFTIVTASQASDTKTGRRDAEEFAYMGCFSPAADDDRVLAFDDFLDRSLPIGPRCDHILDKVLVGDAVAGRPASQAQAVLSVSFEVDNFAQMLEVSGLLAALPLAINLKWAGHGLLLSARYA